MDYVFPPAAVAAVPVQGSAAQFPVHRIYCVGRNYVEHAVEMGYTGREPPFFFLKPADTVLPVAAGATGKMRYPSLTKSLHHEIELVVAIGTGGSDIRAEDAARHIFGYAIGLDMTRRDLQNEAKKLGRPWSTGKGFDESAPIGPIVPAGQFHVGAETPIALEVNGVARQASTLGKLIWSIGEIVEHLSRAWALQPGDLIFTGTPEGVAAVKAGDRLVGRIEGLGELRVEITPR